MTLPEEFADVLAGTVSVPDPDPDPGPVAGPPAEPDTADQTSGAVPGRPAAGPVAGPVAGPLTQAEPVEVPAPRTPAGRGTPRMGPDAKDLPALDLPELPELGPGAPPGTARDLRLLADVQVELAVELGRVKLPLRELLALGPGAVLELDRAADAPVDVLVNGCLVARGEVVVIDGDFGVRVTAVVER